MWRPTLAFLTMLGWGVAPVFAGPIWDETVHGDAGSFISTAQHTAGTGPIERIQGTLGPSDLEDVFAIRITDFASFTATTFATSFGTSSFDTQLWLFDSTGIGVLGNNDDPGGDIGSHLTGVTSNGVYYIAISGLGNVPLAGGLSIFDLSTNTEISGPDGPGGTGTLDGWSGSGETGSYSIHFTGAEFYEVPLPSTISLLAVAALVGRRRWR